jgi:hypothetical protein
VREVNEAKPETAAGADVSTVPQAACLGRLRDPRPSSSENQQSELDHRERCQAGDHGRPRLVREAIAPRVSRRPARIRDRPTSKRTESLEEPRRGDPVSAAATRSPSQPGEANCRLGSPHGVAQICPSVECKRFEGECLVGLPRASLWLGHGGCGSSARQPFAQGGNSERNFPGAYRAHSRLRPRAERREEKEVRLRTESAGTTPAGGANPASSDRGCGRRESGGCC